TETGPKEPMWKREVSFSRKPEEEPAAESRAVDPVAAESEVAAVPDDHVQVSDTGTGPEEPVWKREVSFSRKPEEEPAAESPAVEPVAAESEVVAVPDDHVQVSDT